MNILLLGPSDSVFIRDFCLYVLKKGEDDSVLLYRQLSTQYTSDYCRAGIREIKWPDFLLKGIRKQFFAIPTMIKEWRTLKDKIGFKNEIDVMHVHYVEPIHLIYFFPFWKRAKKRVLTFWGSDFFSATRGKLMLYPYFLKHATSIVFMIPNQSERFQNVFGHRYDEKIEIIDFGNSLLKEIDLSSQQYTVEECKNHFKIPADKLIVHIGYNASRAQQHIEIIESLAVLPRDIISKLYVVFHISYGVFDGFENYKSKIEEIMQGINLDYKFINTYLQAEKLAMFRRTCDIFVYGQRTDARSASPLEYIYAGARFICPGWLRNNYELLDEAEISYYSYDDFEKLPNVLSVCVSEMELCTKKISKESKKVIYDEISWDSLAVNWRKLYE